MPFQKPPNDIKGFPEVLIDEITKCLDAKSLVMASQNSLFYPSTAVRWQTLVNQDFTNFPKLKKKESYKNFYACAYSLLNRIKKEINKPEPDKKLMQGLFAEVIEGGYEKLIPCMLKYVNLSKPFVDFQPVNTYLHLAAVSGHAHLVAFLLKNNVPINPVDPGFNVIGQLHMIISAWVPNQGTIPLARAAEKGHVECVKLLIEAKSMVNYKSQDFGDTPLHHAARSGNVECVKALLDARANLTIKNHQNQTALQMAEDFGNTECYQVITEEMQKRGIPLPQRSFCAIS